MNHLQLLLACLSIEWLNTSYTVAYVLAPASTVVVVACLVIEARRKRFSWLVIYAPLFILQPAWRLVWGEIQSGQRQALADCGFSYRGEAIFLFITLATMLVTLLGSRANKRLFLLRLTIGCWIVHVGVFLVRFFPYDYAIFSAVFPRSVALELVNTIEIGQAQIIGYTAVLTVVCCALYVHERRKGLVRAYVQNG